VGDVQSGEQHPEFGDSRLDSLIGDKGVPSLEDLLLEDELEEEEALDVALFMG